MKNRQLDATLQSSGLGSAALKDLSSTQDVTYVSIPAEVAGTLGAPYAAGVIPAGTYPGQDEDIPTLAITNILVTHSDVSDELAYEMTKLLFENLDHMKSAHAAAGAIDIDETDEIDLAGATTAETPRRRSSSDSPPAIAGLPRPCRSAEAESGGRACNDDRNGAAD